MKGEFKKHVKKYRVRKKIKMIRWQTYNLRAQGKVERAYRILRRKFTLTYYIKKELAVNWVKYLPWSIYLDNMKCWKMKKESSCGNPHLRFVMEKKQFFFSMWVFFHEHSRFTGQHGKGEGIYLTPLYHFHPLPRHLDISQAITAESSPLHIASSRTRTGNLWLPSASR